MTEIGFSLGHSLLTLSMPLCVGLLLSAAMELLLTPKSRMIWQRPLASNLLHLGTWLIVFAAELVLFRRPWFAMGNVLAIQLLIVLVNNAKYHAMREPFLVHDFEYFTDAIRHPRLYLPFFGIANALLALCAFIGVLVAGVMLEPSVFSSAQASVGSYIVSWGILLAVGVAVTVWGYKVRVRRVLLQPEHDYCALGQIGFLWHYGILHYTQPNPVEENQWRELLPQDAAAEKLPDVVVVQSESFFDARAEYPVLKPSILAEFDQICAHSFSWGALTVPAWGANTIRTESAFLTGKPAHVLGVHQFSPYRHFMKQPQYTVAHALKALGYRTVCIHPYPASFYLRDKLYPRMGFDEFIDIQSFTEADKVGQYVGDVALADKVKSILSKRSHDSGTSTPVFVFVITMENHGPLHLEKASQADQVAFYEGEQPFGCDDLTVYARHLRNADTMAAMLTECLNNQPNGGVLGWYGDHVPIMAKVYQTLGAPKGDTRYFIWNDHPTDGLKEASSTSASSKDISELPTLLFQALSARYKTRLAAEQESV